MHRKSNFVILSALFVMCISFTFQTISASGVPGENISTGRSSDKPIVDFIFADDLGWVDLQRYGYPYAKTPAIDGLAGEEKKTVEFSFTDEAFAFWNDIEKQWTIKLRTFEILVVASSADIHLEERVIL